MLGMQDDVSDIELKQRWRLYWIHSIFEFSNIELQKKSWAQRDEELSEEEIWSRSFEECASAYLDNLALYNGYDKALEYGNVSEEEAQNAAAFHQLVYMYDEPSDDPADILADEEWLEVVKTAQVFWHYLKENVSSQREVELIKELEKDFL